MKEADCGNLLTKHYPKEEKLFFHLVMVLVSFTVLFSTLIGFYIYKSFLDRERVGYIRACEDFYHGKLKMEPVKKNGKIHWVEVKE